MSLILSAQTGTAVTAAQLLGEGEEELEARTSEAEKKATALLKQMKKAGIGKKGRK